MAAKKQSYYIPVTMDELMARFVTNMERNELKEKFKSQRSVLMKQNLCGLENKIIENGVKLSFTTMKHMLNNKPIDMERQPNVENKLYLKLMEFANLRKKAYSET